LKQILAREEVVIWAEGEAIKKLAAENIHASDRLSITPGLVLAIWTTPPGRKELQAVLEYVKPVRVLVFAISPEIEPPDVFLRRLAGMVKYSIKSQQGILQLERLAAVTAQRVAVVRKGIAWLEDKGYYKVVSEEAGEVMVEENVDGNRSVEINKTSRELSALMQEVRSYREYFHRVAEIKL